MYGSISKFELLFAAWLLMLIMFVLGIQSSPLMDTEEAKHQLVLRAHARIANIDVGRELNFANSYWDRNQDIRNHQTYGEFGSLGPLGARQHYDDYGREDGRRWGVEY